MKIVNSIIAACILTLAVTITQAQTVSDFKKMSEQQKAKFISDSLKTNLNLSKAQYDKVYAETLAGIKKIAPVVKTDHPGMQNRQQIFAFLSDEEDRLKAILTPQQFELFQAKKQKAMAYYIQHMGDQKIIFNVPQ